MFTYLIDQAGALNGPIELPPIPGLGAQRPSNAVELSEILPVPITGHAWALVEDKPQEVEDRRGMVYRTDSGRSEEWTRLGELPDGYTDAPCPGLHYVWFDGAWQLDSAAQLAAAASEVRIERDFLLRDAGVKIAPLQYAHDLGDATAEEEAVLLSLKLYSVALSRIEKQPGYPLQVDWPIPPASAE
ncbi:MULTISPECIES: tail fiber assembly protein [unclassified Pseudomonas]|uniref:tail fiber assembly protein n=1 Tax=unclassified Pseudomonas TaxID=196821 RepID=UPI002A360D56|nr:tail fiber assembly protein [Pseudomonas sp. P9_31]WPN56705.1 tail fiber assembly protein [Pseudomonas sp. P9_31]